QNQKMKAILPSLGFVLMAVCGPLTQAQLPPRVGAPPAKSVVGLGQGSGTQGPSQLPRPAADQSPPPAAARPPAGTQPARASISGEELMRKVVAAVDAQPSISANVRHKVALLGQEVLGSGVYLQQGRGPARQWRSELKLK